MRRIALWFTALIPVVLGLAACATEPTRSHVTLEIGVVDSFAPVMRELAQSYSRHQPWVTLNLVQANTAKLEQDLKEGKAFDLYIPSQPASMDALAGKDAINPLSRKLLAINQLMVITAPDSGLSLSDQIPGQMELSLRELTNASVRQIAVASPNLLLGHLTREALTTLQMLPNHEATPLGQPNSTPTSDAPALPANLASLAAAQKINLEPKLLVVTSEKEVLEAVADGRAQAGITYASYAVNNKKVRILAPLKFGSYEYIAYNVAIPRNAPHNDEAWQFLNYLRSAEAHAIMQRAGLLVN